MEDVSGVFVDENRPPLPIRRNSSNVSKMMQFLGQVEVISVGVHSIETFLLGKFVIINN